MEPHLIREEIEKINLKIDKIIMIQNNNNNKIELEKNLEEIYTYIDIKFEEQEHLIKNLINIKNSSDDITESSFKKEKNKKFLEEKIILTLKALIIIILNFLIILFIIGLLYYFNLNETTIITYSDINENKEINNCIIKKIIKHLLFIILQIIYTYLLFKNNNFPPSSSSYNENNFIEPNYNELFSIFNEIDENHSIISDILDNISENLDEDKAYNILDHLKSEYNKREEMLSQIQLKTEKFLEELDSNNSFYELPINNKDEEIKFSLDKKGLIISSTIIGSSIIITKILPILLDIIIK